MRIAAVCVDIRNSARSQRLRLQAPRIHAKQAQQEYRATNRHTARRADWDSQCSKLGGDDEPPGRLPAYLAHAATATASRDPLPASRASQRSPQRESERRTGPDRTSQREEKSATTSDYAPISAERSTNQGAPRTRNNRIKPQNSQDALGRTRTPRTRTKGTHQVGLARPNPLNKHKPADIKNDRPTSGKGNAHAHSGDRPGKRGRVRS